MCQREVDVSDQFQRQGLETQIFRNQLTSHDISKITYTYVPSCTLYFDLIIIKNVNVYQ